MNQTIPAGLPTADATEQQFGDQVKDHIINRINRNGGSISFAEFMHLALYAPGLGYYTAGKNKFGEAGDFITAPEISSLFGYCLAQQCADIIGDVDNADILEIGAGSGKLACDMLARLEQLGQLPAHYYILEVSADLRQRQQQLLGSTLPQLADRVLWLDTLPTRFRGIIIANELLDAMPVERFLLSGNGIEQLGVATENGELCWQRQPANDVLTGRVNRLGLSAPYISEINFNAEAWIASLADIIDQGLVLLIDYGFPEHEYYHADRREGTLMCHYKHHSHDNPLVLTGLQDITAHVDFTAVAQAAVDNGLDVAGYTSQAAFLIGCGLEQLAADLDLADDRTRLSMAAQISKLTQPSEMGELFKVIGLGKHINTLLRGFMVQDRRDRL
ncbi:MAG: SAM-dependent methyltransferase [Gammaproteobacteria bacterium]|nr:SAM-dependent methyltransferase [Gammaproteobacteria bacterium]